MEVSLATRLFAVRGVKSTIPIVSSPKRRGKHQDANKLCKAASLSTQSCQPEKKSVQENGQRKLQFPAFANVELHRHKVAISDLSADYLYEDVYLRSWDLARAIADTKPAPGARVALLCGGGLSHVVGVWACWLAGHAAVPLCPGGGEARLEHLVMDSAAELVIATADQAAAVHTVTKRHGHKLIVLDDTWWSEPKQEADLAPDSALPPPPAEPEQLAAAPALVLYTAGMTGPPRGVVYSHRGVARQVEAATRAWDLGPADTILHSLRLDSVYGAINSLQAPLASGARVKLVPLGDPTKIWSNLLGVGLKTGKALPKISVFPSTPLIYSSLLRSYAEHFTDKKTKEYVKTACTKRIRLMVSSSSALPASLNTQWKNITGHKIVDNFVSTESGTGLEARETQIVRFRDHTKAAHEVLHTAAEDADQPPVIGELRLRLDTEEGEQPRYVGGEAERLTCEEGWFHTGDLVEHSGGGHKLWGKLNMYSVLHKGSLVTTADIEKKILSHKDIEDCYVLGLGDIQGEQQLAAIIVLTKTKKVNVDAILEWCGHHMREEEVPTIFKLVSKIERDNQGHVDKVKLRPLFNEEDVLCFHDCKL